MSSKKRAGSTANQMDMFAARLSSDEQVRRIGANTGDWSRMPIFQKRMVAVACVKTSSIKNWGDKYIGVAAGLSPRMIGIMRDTLGCETHRRVVIRMGRRIEVDTSAIGKRARREQHEAARASVDLAAQAHGAEQEMSVGLYGVDQDRLTVAGFETLLELNESWRWCIGSRVENKVWSGEAETKLNAVRDSAFARRLLLGDVLPEVLADISDSRHVIDDFVYFVRTERYVKIGRSYGHGSRRLSAICNASPFDVSIVGRVSGGSEMEAWLHRTFDEYRHRLEWFKLEGKVVEFVDWMRRKGCVVDESEAVRYIKGRA